MEVCDHEETFGGFCLDCGQQTDCDIFGPKSDKDGKFSSGMISLLCMYFPNVDPRLKDFIIKYSEHEGRRVREKSLKYLLYAYLYVGSVDIDIPFDPMEYAKALGFNHRLLSRGLNLISGMTESSLPIRVPIHIVTIESTFTNIFPQIACVYKFHPELQRRLVNFTTVLLQRAPFLNSENRVSVVGSIIRCFCLKHGIQQKHLNEIIGISSTQLKSVTNKVQSSFCFL